MSDVFNYALTQKDDGNFVVRSSVSSFGLNQITDKDVVSFYKAFSTQASFDTGLMPLDGTGILAIRSAGNHMQVTVQHAPGCYHINWGATEGDKDAKTYYVAQPYRIVVGDFQDGNLLGAKMFYSPIPITHADQPLYHVNLPNINCKGYRGNAVGWICLYLKEDWSSLSFNMKVSRMIERCSGVETYNDANMSETDGPRFYQEHIQRSFPERRYLWDPSQWQLKSSVGHLDSFEWTLESNLWIPVLVTSMDDQSKHDPSGIPLTFSMALLGNYKAYYSDNNIPKLYNIVARNDLNMDNKRVAGMIKSSFALSNVLYAYDNKDNPYKDSVVQNEKKGSTTLLPPGELFPQQEDEDEESETWTCDSCQEEVEESPTYEVHGNPICASCINEYFVYIESQGEYYSKEDPNVFYAENDDIYYHKESDQMKVCDNCQFVWGGSNESVLPVYAPNPASIVGSVVKDTFCQKCIVPLANTLGFESDLKKCSECNYNDVIDNPLVFDSYFKTHIYVSPAISNDSSIVYEKHRKVYCAPCSNSSFSIAESYVCPCGLLRSASTKDEMVVCESTEILSGEDNECISTVTQCCKSCIGNFHQSATGDIVGSFVPQNQELFDYTVNTFSIFDKKCAIGFDSKLDVNKIIF